MTSAVKTECMHLLLHALSYGGSPEADAGEGEFAGVGFGVIQMLGSKEAK